ncbi:polyphosphate polymerase domain-containing protein [Nocardiopsis suaedae]|uniref:Polyphosphate polymerase domain-containing protein n=1 Tax=Nocardiopsis suaedae TaxID=3018444 RepID=A0ABT4TG68_9ACTN|nr:polyphosphate polymerase domain-containing protein [Nocardiopsis suaedae]MDA2803640.1 polyphosphate polymerase domain-containing protein [Nocardiopsis suaedae]
MSPALAAAFPPITLEEAVERAGLQARVDRKYLIPRGAFAEFERRLADQEDWRELEIAGRRGGAYSSTYFDTPDLLTFRQHRQGRRRRFKLRTRAYLDTGTAHFEVKLQGSRRATLKERIAHPFDRRDELTPEARDFAAEALGEGYGQAPPRALVPSAVTSYRRRTLVQGSGQARLTLDERLVFSVGGDRVTVPDGWVLAETKSPGTDTPADRELRRLGVRPRPVSKYCLAVACLYPGTRGNPWKRTLRDLFGPDAPPPDPPFSPAAVR